jgi:hypothetical protein
MSDSKLKPYANIKAKVREYEDKETGKMKGVYVDVGTMFASPHLSNITIKLDTVPIGNNWNGWLSVFKREDFNIDNNEEETEIKL